MEAQLNSIGLNTYVADANGSFWYLLSMAGWDSPVLRQQTLDIPSKHGVVTTEGLYGSRNIEITGLCKAVSEAAFYDSWYFLLAETNFLKRTTFPFKVTEGATTRFCDVFRNGEVRINHIGVGSFDFNVLMRADDPFKYTDVLNSEGFNANISEVIVNGGTARSYPTITMNATGTPTITMGALTWTASGSIPSGTVIDMKNQTILNGSTSHFDKFDLTSEWLFMEPGNNTTESTVPMTVQWRDAWV